MNVDAGLRTPPNIGRYIIETAGIIARDLLGTDDFVRFCQDRDLRVDRARLLRLERLGLFAPVLRVRTPDDESAPPFVVPIREGGNWFERGWAWDTTANTGTHPIPEDNDPSQEAYYSIFQVGWLDNCLNMVSLEVHGDLYLQDARRPQIDDWLVHLEELVKSIRQHQFPTAVAWLCQAISNYYYPKTQGDGRFVRSGGRARDSDWMVVSALDWSWEHERAKWNPAAVESVFELTQEKLKYAYGHLASMQAFSDPIEEWYPLVQFISLDKRQRLKGAALRSETLREGAHMLRWLYQDLYKETLPPPNEVNRTVIRHMPELSVRKDVRRHLEFVSNRFGVNPQPRVVLFVEGESEERIVGRIFEEGFGFHTGTASIEVVNIHGVGNATGDKKRDRFRAILRLIDYLHHHQSLCFLILDNENYSSRLKEEAMNASSIHGIRNRATPEDRIHIWNQTVEFDNLDDIQLASALTAASDSTATFTPGAVAVCRLSKKPGKAISDLYRNASNKDLPKLRLADEIVNIMLAAKPDALAKHPIVDVLHRVANLAIRNPLPTMEEIWRSNQRSKIFE